MITDIKAIPNYQSLTSQEIADTLRASGVTHSSIDRATLVHILNIRGMLRKIVGNNSDEKWVGTVLNMQDAILAMGTDPQKDGIRLWFSHITNVTNIMWDTRLAAFASPFWSMVQVFADQPGMPTSDDFAAIAALGGGWKFASVTAEQVEAAIADEAKNAVIQTARTSVYSRTTAIGAWLDAYDVSDKTIEQVQAYVDSLLASEDGNP